MSLYHLFLVLMITTSPALCFTKKNVQPRTAQLFLGKDGKLLDSSRAPNCGLANKIILKSYTYNEMKCRRGSCNSVHEEELSNFTALQLHQNCSFRQTCDSLHFPVPISLKNSTRDLLDVTIQYQCIDDQILDMCEKHKMGFTDTLHLTLKYYTKNLKNCECWVNEGAFTLTIVDLRLKSRKEDVCSTAKLVVNSHHFPCKPVSDSYGAIFGDKYRIKHGAGAYISLVPDSNRTLPEMVWIQLTPEESCQLQCYGDQIASGQSTNMYTVTSSQGLSKTSVVRIVNTTNISHSSVTTSAEEKVPTTPSPPPRDEGKVPTTPAPPPTDDKTAFWIVIVILIVIVVLVLLLVAVLVKRQQISRRKIAQLRSSLQSMQNERQSGDQSGDEIVTADQSAVSWISQRVDEVSEHQVDEIESSSTSRDIGRAERLHASERESMSGRIINEDHPSSRSLCNIKSESEALSCIPAQPKSLDDLTKICESQRKQMFGFQSENQRRPVTIPNTPDQSPSNSSLEIATPTNAQHYTSVKGREAGYDLTAGVNGGRNTVSLAKDNDSDFEAEDSEQKILLENSSTDISLTKKKASFRK